MPKNPSAVDVNRYPNPKLMQPGLIRPAGADLYRLPNGYGDGNSDKGYDESDIGDICPGCGK